MKIRQINLTNFKGFTSTKIGDIPDTAKLIVVVGPNGCGKSSLIDAVLFFHRQTLAGFGGYDETYHRKQIPNAIRGAGELVQVNFHDPQPNSQAEKRKAVYARQFRSYFGELPKSRQTGRRRRRAQSRPLEQGR